MKLKLPGRKLLVRRRLNLSTRLILAMASMVFLTALASVVIFNIIITNQTHDVEVRVQKAFTEFQEYRRQNPPPVQPTLSQIKQILGDSTLTADQQLAKINESIYRSDSQVNPQIIYGILHDSGLPVTMPYQHGPGPGPGPNQNPQGYGNNPSKLIKISGNSLEEGGGQNILLSPVVQSFVLGSGLAAICAVLLGFFLARTVIKPLRGLEQASERIADGNYTLQVGPEGRDDLGRLARSFNKMAQALRLTEQKRKELVADVAHELRTPLSSIQGYTEVLRDGLITNRDRQDEIYDHILQEVRQLTKMVESMRVWMSNEQALEHLNVEEIPAQLSAKMVIERFRPAANRKEVELVLATGEGSEEAEVHADSDALNHVLSNLVDNALRYTKAGGEVQLKIGPVERLSDYKKPIIWFSVKDNGSGIPAEHLPFVFERFYRVDKSRDRNTGGTGLGLAIVRDTVQALGGEVKIESTVGEGTEITFWLPVVQIAKPSERWPLLTGSK